MGRLPFGSQIERSGQEKEKKHGARATSSLWDLSLVGQYSSLAVSAGFGVDVGISCDAVDPSWSQKWQVRRTILEVLQYDPQTREVLVASGWEGKTDWYRNIEREPALEVRIGRVVYQPVQEFLLPDETASLILTLFQQHAREVRFVGPLLGIDPHAPEPLLRARLKAFFQGVRFGPAHVR